MPGKRRFANKDDENKTRVQRGLANAAQRRLGLGANQPGAKFGAAKGGKVSGGGLSSATGPAASFAANSKGRFTPRTLTGRPASSGPGNAAVKLGEFGRLGAPGFKKKASS